LIYLKKFKINQKNNHYEII